MSPQRPQLRIRVALSPGVALGPGKADLLECIAASGSISAAARQMRMSYKRGWTLVDDMNRAFKSPVVASVAGGVQGGGAMLTANGKRVLALYRKIECQAAQACDRELAAIARLTAPDGEGKSAPK
ncbi:MAG: LysR family transcriptional regulator [Rudaea sp.]|nr:LysR family transcriptional regulator [Rudaea sp.]